MVKKVHLELVWADETSCHSLKLSLVSWMPRCLGILAGILCPWMLVAASFLSFEALLQCDSLRGGRGLEW